MPQKAFHSVALTLGLAQRRWAGTSSIFGARPGQSLGTRSDPSRTNTPRDLMLGRRGVVRPTSSFAGIGRLEVMSRPAQNRAPTLTPTRHCWPVLLARSGISRLVVRAARRRTVADTSRQGCGRRRRCRSCPPVGSTCRPASPATERQLHGGHRAGPTHRR